MSEKHIEELIIRFIEGTCPDEEMRELLDWVRESTEHRDTLFGMKDIYDRSRLRERMTDEQIDAGWMRLVAECGIPEEELPLVFRRFYVGTNNRENGTGLGLYIVQSIVTELGGSISVRSDVGKGTVFTMCFPQAD